MRWQSYDVWVSEKAVDIGPLAGFRRRGEICDAVKSSVRTLHVLEVLVGAGRPLRAVEIAGALKLSPSSGHQLLKTMVDSAYLIFDFSSKRYYPSPRLHKLGAMLSDDYFGSGTIVRFMRSAGNALGLTLNLATSQGGFMQVLDIFAPASTVPSGSVRGVDEAIGFQIPLFGSCTGAAWLSMQDKQTIRASINLCRRELGPKAKEVPWILDRIQRVRKQGYAFGGVSSEKCRSRGLSVPLPRSSSGVVLVLSAHGPAEEMDRRRDEIADVLKRATTLPCGGLPMG